jgi:hypothetical protein
MGTRGIDAHAVGAPLFLQNLSIPFYKEYITSLPLACAVDGQNRTISGFNAWKAAKRIFWGLGT